MVDAAAANFVIHHLPCQSSARVQSEPTKMHAIFGLLLLAVQTLEWLSHLFIGTPVGYYPAVHLSHAARMQSHRDTRDWPPGGGTNVVYTKIAPVGR